MHLRQFAMVVLVILIAGLFITGCGESKKTVGYKTNKEPSSKSPIGESPKDQSKGKKTGGMSIKKRPDAPKPDPKQSESPKATLEVPASQNTVKAEDLTKAFAKDKLAAREKYGDLSKVLTIEGEITKILKVSDKMTHVYLKGHKPVEGKKEINIQCTLKDPSDAKDLKVGEKIILAGNCFGAIAGTIMVVDAKVTIDK